MKKQRIELRGVILDASWDLGWLDSYIAKGVFTPESRVRAQLKAAETAGEEVELYISSQGGSCIAGNEILAALADYPHAKSIVVGAYAASMAANILLQAGVKVKAHNNSLLLFHGSFGVTFGGKGAHEDSAAIMGRINEPIMKALLARGVPADVVEQGFAEGRELTMTAAEAKRYGIVAEIIDEPAAPAARLEKAEEEALLAQGSELPIAACTAWQTADLAALAQTQGQGEGEGEGESKETAGGGSGGTEPGSEGEGGGETDGEGSGGTEPGTEGQDTAAHGSAELCALLDRLTAMETQRRDLQSQRDKLAAQVETMRTEHASAAKELQGQVATLTAAKTDLESRLSRMVLNALGTPAGDCAQSWDAALKECGDYEAAAKKYPHLAAAYRKERSGD